MNPVPVELVLGREWRDDVRYLSELRPHRPADARLNLVEICDIVDLVVDGTNLTAAITEESVFGFVHQLMDGLWSMTVGRTEKVVVEFHCEPWELCLVADGQQLLVSLYSVDRRQRVVAHDIPVDGVALIRSVVRAAEELLADLLSISERFASDPFVRHFSSVLGKLRRVHDVKFSPRDLVPKSPRSLNSSTTSGAGLTVAYELNAGYHGLRLYGGEQAFDQHALLVPGEMTAEWNGRTLVLCDDYPVLVVRALLTRVRSLLSLLESSTNSFVCDSDLTRLRLDVRGEGGLWHAEIAAGNGNEEIALVSRPNPLLDTFLTVAEMIVADLVNENEHLQLNQRFADIATEIEELRSWHADFAEANHYQEDPEKYLVEHGDLRPVPEAEPRTSFDWPLADVRAIYPELRWTFAEPKINFGAVAATEDDLFVPTDSALVALDAETGEERWRRAEFDGAAVSSYAVAGEHVVVADEEHMVRLLDPRTGEASHDEAVSLGTLIVGATAYQEGDLVIVADFHGRIAGLGADGDVRWRFDAGHGLLTGMGCDGPVACVMSSPGFVHGINPLTGAVLWKVRLGGLSDAGPYFHQGRVYTFSHDARTDSLTIHAMFPYTGRAAWQARFEGSLAGEPDFVDELLIFPLERHGKVSLVGVDVEKSSPVEKWRLEVLSAGVDRPTHVSTVEIDGVLHGVVRTDTAEITCFSLDDGEIRWRVEHERPADLLFRNLDLTRVRDSILCVGERMQLRAIEDGRLLHSFGDVMIAPEFVAVRSGMQVVLGERGAEKKDPDQLVSFAIGHFLALVRED